MRKPIYEKRLDEIEKDLRKEAEYIGEDGDMVCQATTERGALIKFKRRIREDCGDLDAEEVEMQYVGVGWLRLPHSVEEENQGDDPPVAWLVSFEKPHENIPCREVYVYAL